MPKAEDTQVYLELTQYSLRAVRATGAVVEAAGECVLENRASLEALLDAVAPGRKATGIRALATVWPAASQWYLSTDTEAMLDRTEEALKAIAAGKQKNPSAPFAYAVCGAGDGTPVTPDGMDKWVLAFSPLESLEASRKGLADLGVDPEEVKPAGFAGVAAVSAALGLEGTGGSVVLWDIGTESSNLILVTARGVEGAVPCGVGMEGIYEAVQIALKLKFRGAGARLFFNETYDFTDPGPKVGAIVGAKVREALAELPPMPDPPRLACMGVTGKQAWFIRVVAAVAGLTPWEPDVLKFLSEAGLTFADGVDAASFSATSAGLLGLIAMRVAGIDAWSAGWAEAEGQPEEEPAPPPPVVAELEPEPEPEPVREPEPPVRAAPPARHKPSLSIDTQQGSGAPARPRPSVAPKSVTTPPMQATPQRPPSTQGAPPPGPPRVQMRPMSAPAPTPAAPPDFSGQAPAIPPAPAAGAPAMSFPTPGGAARPPTFSSPGFPAPGAPAPGGTPPSFPSRAAPAPSFPTPGAPAPSFPAPGKPATPVPGAGAPAMSFPTPGGTARPPSFSNPGFPTPGAPPPGPARAMPPPPGPGGTANPMGAEAPPARAVTALPFEAVKLKGVPMGAAKAGGETTPPVPPPPPKSRVGFFIAVGVAGALLFAGIAVVVEARLDRIRAHDLEQQEALKAQIKEQELEKQERLQKAQQEADEKERAIEVAAAKKRAEEETKAAMLAQFEQERLAKLPGTILVATTPSGAAVSIDGAAPLTSPVKASGIQPGSHTLHITLAAHDPLDLKADLKGNSTLDMGTVALQPSLGSLELTSSPDGLDFAVRPAGDPAAKPVHAGRTPASFDDIVHGDYVVTFVRPGCHDHVEKATIERGAKTSVTTTYVNGSLELSSDPSGANVNKDGSFLGTTPLTLHDLTPKMTPFVLTLPGYDSTPITCDIPEGQTLTYSAQLLRRDRVFTASEVKTPAVKLKAPAPVLSASQRQLGGTVVISLVVTSDGLVRDVQVESASDDDIGRRCKEAVEQWQFGPATAPDDRLVDSRVEVPFKFAPGSP